MKTEYEKQQFTKGLLGSQSTYYTETLGEIEEIFGICIEPMAYEEERRVIANGRVLCLYRMSSGRYEAFSYKHRVSC